MATPIGFEPTTSSVTGWHSNHLNYGAICGTPNRTQTYDLRFRRALLYSTELLGHISAELRGIFSEELSSLRLGGLLHAPPYMGLPTIAF